MAERKKSAVIFAGRTDDALVAMIEDGDASLQSIADQWGVSKLQLARWIDASPERAARCREARKAAADWCDRQAEKVLLDLRPNATGAEIARARELASHYRWRARVRDPERYAERVTVKSERVPGIPMEQWTDAELNALIALGKPLLEGRADLVSVTENGEHGGAE
jgi:hypothetical protein